MSYEALKKWRNSTKQMLMDCLGSRCNKCGYERYVGAMDFHHTENKSDSISSMLRNLRKTVDIIDEAKNCVLLCKVCHHELHGGLWTLDEIERVIFDTKKLIGRWNKVRTCQVCKKDFEPKDRRVRHCSKECFNLSRRKAERPSVAVLKQLLWEKPTTEIAAELGVTGTAVAKWAKQYGLEKPPRGYWS